jgi:hypothetical protein
MRQRSLSARFEIACRRADRAVRMVLRHDQPVARLASSALPGPHFEPKSGHAGEEAASIGQR